MEYKKLGDIATYINGYAFKPSDWSDNGLPIIRIQDLTGNSYNLNYYNGEYPEKVEINNGDVLISWSASLGVYQWNGGKALLNQHIFKVVFDKCEINIGYFMLAIEYALDSMKTHMHGATMKHITKKDFDNIKIPFPPLNMQEQIAIKIKKVRDIKDYKQKQIKLFDNLIKSRFVEMFGNESNSKQLPIRSMNELVDVSVGIVVKPAQYYTDDTENGIKTFRSLNIGTMTIKDESWVYLTKEGNNKNAKSIVKENDLLIVRSGNPGTTCVVTKNFENCNVIDAIIARPKTDIINSYYLGYFINNPHGMIQINCEVGGAAQQHFNVNKFKTIKVFYPPVYLQNEFADFVEQVNKSKFVVQKSIDELQTLYDSLMQKYFG